MLLTAISRRGIPVRLTDERWAHVVEEHCELAGMINEILETLASPDRILLGNRGECLAVRMLSAAKALVVVYREDMATMDGFVITAFVTSRMGSLERRPQLWP